MLRKGLLISFAGISGAGKKTQAALLCKLLRDRGIVAEDLPNIPCFAELVFETIAKKSGFEKATELFPPSVVSFAAAIDSVRTYTIFTEKMLDQGMTIIMPRYTHCRIAEAIHTKSQHLELLGEIYEWLPKPDLTFYLDVTADIAVERKYKGINKSDIRQDLSALKRCYEELPEFGDFVKIDADGSIEATKSLIDYHANKFLNSTGTHLCKS